ncbi:hypothetical protein [Mesoterricola silvestris]|uniref:Uncharacterized protein n=1 Tax=Mesoterricola silvestris TaxID=2927979 RepID=A0AA48KAC8_9BACT|nr:hypothetical protein [Mesoterricola silvestris]BDU74914.1 hypothetical protein METEAL_40880 [Mesoterricola silvestris]
MEPDLTTLLETLRRMYPTSLVRTLPEPAMFLRSNTGRTFHAEGMQVLSAESALAYASAYMRGLRERIAATADYQLNEEHPWIIGIHPGDLTSPPLIFIFGNIIRSGKEAWVELGYPRYEALDFPS